MNILFHTYGKLEPTKGGTERTTITLATALTREYGCRCFSSYEDANAHTPKADCVIDEYRWEIQRNRQATIKECREMLLRFGIDAVIVQGSFIHVPIFREAAKGMRCRIILAHHFEPGWDVSYISFRDLLSNKPGQLVTAFRWLKDIILYPLLRRNYYRLMHDSYKTAYQTSDIVVLLTTKFIDKFRAFGQFEDKAKFRIIPNGLSLSSIAKETDIFKKKKIVLIVSRLDEHFKRISLALNIWREAKKDARSDGWHLNIVGHGADEGFYKNLVRKKNIPDVHFLGRQAPEPYYKEAAIFLMTSRSESWGLTLTEAQQTGVVPIAFDSYDSLSEIITHEQDGLIIPEGNTNQYVSDLLALMANEERRHEFARNGLVSCRKFEPSSIAEQWWQLINDSK